MKWWIIPLMVSIVSYLFLRFKVTDNFDGMIQTMGILLLNISAWIYFGVF